MPEITSTASADSSPRVMLETALPPQDFLVQMLFTSFSLFLTCLLQPRRPPPQFDSTLRHRNRGDRIEQAFAPYLEYRKRKGEDDTESEKIGGLDEHLHQEA